MGQVPSFKNWCAGFPTAYVHIRERAVGSGIPDAVALREVAISCSCGRGVCSRTVFDGRQARIPSLSVKCPRSMQRRAARARKVRARGS